MGIVDAFSKEDRVEVKFSDFYNLMKEATKAEMLMNGANCETPHAYMREIMTGKREEEAHAHSDVTVHIKPIICGIDTGTGESQSPLQQYASTQEQKDTQEEAVDKDPDPWEEADKAGAVDPAESEG